MRRPSFTQACLATTLVLAPVAGMLGYAGARYVEMQQALAASRHAGAALDGALGACRALQAGAEEPPPAAARHVVGLTLG